jgi:hypothetical protein
MKHAIGDRIYYTGDMANHSGWFRVERTDMNGNLRLVEDGTPNHGRTMAILPMQIGDVYQGHCNPRFVTELAYATYYATSIENLRTHASFRRIV